MEATGVWERLCNTSPVCSDDGEDNSEEQREESVTGATASKWTEVGTKSQKHHHEQLVVPNAETMSEDTLKRCFSVLYVGGVVSFVLLLILAVLVGKEAFEDVAGRDKLLVANVVVGCLCTLVMVSLTMWHVVQVMRVSWGGFLWGRRSWRQSCMGLVKYISHTLNCIIYFGTNLWIFSNRSGRVSDVALMLLTFLRFTMWNNIFSVFLVRSWMLNPWVTSKNKPEGPRDDSIMLDAPLRNSWFVFLPWMGFQGILFAIAAFAFSHPVGDMPWNDGDNSYVCHQSTASTILVFAVNAAMVVMQVLCLVLTYFGYKKLRQISYNLYRLVNIHIRYHMFHSGAVGNTITVSFVLLYWVNRSSCSRHMVIGFGILPVYILMTVYIAVDIVLSMPISPDKYDPDDLDPDRLSWLETRMGPMACESKKGPTFSFETALKAWYWSLGVYDYDDATKSFQTSEVCFETAMQLYGLTNHEYIEEESADTHMLLAWNNDTVLLCFRGTYSVANIVTDLKVWRTTHPPKRGRMLLGTRPLVHSGFLDGWMCNGLNERVASRVLDIISSADFDMLNARVIVTGHSLGGALAVLAAYDMAEKCSLPKHQIICYTVGAPRVGNRAFVKDYNMKVPNTWQIVNCDDAVPLLPRFGFMYRHVGHKVIINPGGDLIPNPHGVEELLYSAMKTFRMSTSIELHFLGSYRDSFISVCKAQFVRSKGMKGGMDGVMAVLGKDEKLLSTCLKVNIDAFQLLNQLGSSIWTRHREKLPEIWQ